MDETSQYLPLSFSPPWWRLVVIVQHALPKTRLVIPASPTSSVRLEIDPLSEFVRGVGHIESGRARLTKNVTAEKQQRNYFIL